MKEKNVVVIPSINKSNQLQGFRFQYKGHNLKGSEVHRSMSGSRLVMGIEKHVGEELPAKAKANTGKPHWEGHSAQWDIRAKIGETGHQTGYPKSAGFEIGY